MGEQTRTAVLELKMATASNSLNSLPSRKQLQSAGETRPSLPFHPSQTLLACFLVGFLDLDPCTSSSPNLAARHIGWHLVSFGPAAAALTDNRTGGLVSRAGAQQTKVGSEIIRRNTQSGRLASSPDLSRPPTTTDGMAAPTMRRWLILDSMGELSDLPLSRLRSRENFFRDRRPPCRSRPKESFRTALHLGHDMPQADVLQMPSSDLPV